MKTKTKSKKVNKAWLHGHVNDPYVKQAQREGYRSRAAYKLQEIDEAYALIQPGSLMVDLGCAPGAWSQYARRRMLLQKSTPDSASHGRLIGLDLLPMEPIEGVTFIQGDFCEAQILGLLVETLQGRQADLVVSDMAPNLSGIASVDAARVEYLIELALEFVQNHMTAKGSLLVKTFHGTSYDAVVRRFKETFHTVKVCKPKASRDRSAETFLLGIGLKRP